MHCFHPVKVIIEGNVVIEIGEPNPLELNPFLNPTRDLVVEPKNTIEVKQTNDKKPKKPSAETKNDKKLVFEDDKKFPKVRVTLEAFEELQDFRKKYKCKSYCEVVNKLLNIYDSVKKQDNGEN